ncbi:hypothetical protein HZ326_19170 [Fusarium oxysporum f. sp. albedinis]|nr:hypothetical protein HZ326_19170 [Fusarium oxysporum f. sp. albedinis]
MPAKVFAAGRHIDQVRRPMTRSRFETDNAVISNSMTWSIFNQVSSLPEGVDRAVIQQTPLMITWPKLTDVYNFSLLHFGRTNQAPSS